ncbi:MAG: PRTRC system protein E [Flavobacteriaceae bacterium]|nr:PRTRC system protein E [Flavobacteriaceae bacterium]
MNTNFFNQIAQMDINGSLQINIQQNEDNTLIVSVLVQNESCGDKAKNLIPPLVLRGTSEELDNGFFENIVQPIEKTSALMVNMESYLKAQEQAKKQSAMEKEQAEKEQKAKSEKQKKFDKAIEKAEKLEKEQKYREAWASVPNSKEYPEFANEIKERLKRLEQHFAPNLFQSQS